MNTETNPSHSFTEGADVPNQTPEQAAKEAWENYSLNRAISFQHSGIANVSFMRGIEAYQASLKKMVAAEIVRLNEVNKFRGAETLDVEARISHCNMFLKQITTAMPSEK